MNRALPAAVLAALGACHCLCQTQPSCGDLEVASIKPSPPLDTGRPVSFGRRIDGAQIHFTQASLRDLIRIAWEVRDYQIEAPSWLAAERFDIAGKLPGGCAQAQVPGMLRTLLENRFALKLRRSSKEMPVYALVLRGVLRIRRSPDDPDDQPVKPEQMNLAGGGGRGGIIDYGGGSYFAIPHYRMEARKLPMDVISGLLGRFTDRPIIDRTGLAGRYDFDLDLTEDDYDAMTTRAVISMGFAPSPGDLRQLAATGDPLPKAIRALGLDLKPDKSGVEVLIVDSVAKRPLDN